MNITLSGYKTYAVAILGVIVVILQYYTQGAVDMSSIATEVGNLTNEVSDKAVAIQERTSGLESLVQGLIFSGMATLRAAIGEMQKLRSEIAELKNTVVRK